MSPTDRLTLTQDNQGDAPAEGGGAAPARGAGRPRRQGQQPPPAAAPVGGEVPAAQAETPAPAQGQRQQRQGQGGGRQQGGQGQPRGAAARAPERAAKQDLTGYAVRLKDKYHKVIALQLKKDLSLDNVMQVPRVVKVVLNMGMGESLTNPKAMESAERDLTTITGQKPVITKAKKSIANFKIRQGMPIGMMVTLRGNRMYEFLDRLTNIAMPRVRDFRGAPTNGFDGRGNYSLGLREQVIFPEIDFNSIDRIRGMQITIVTTAKNDDAARRLLTLMGFAFAREDRNAA